MSKHKKKKQRELPAPPLSKLDLFIYNAIILIGAVLAIVTFMGSYYAFEFVGYADESVMLSYSRLTSFWILPAVMLAFIPLLNFFGTGLNEKKPIFGNRKVNYFSTTRYRGVHFLFEKKNNSKNKKTRIIIAIVLISLIVICTVFALFGRCSIDNNGEIKVYSVLNTVKTEYSVDDISSVTIEIGEEHTRYGNYRPMCWVWVEMIDGKDFKFVLSDAYWCYINVDDKISNISNLKTIFDDKNVKVTVTGDEYINELIEYYELSEKERVMLAKLFE